MIVYDKHIKNSIEFLKAYAVNDNKLNYSVTLGLIFNKNKLATKKKLKAEESLLTEFSKHTLFYPHTFGNAPTIALFTLKNITELPGIDYIGSDSLIRDIQNNTINPNYLLSYRDEMSFLSKYSRILGPKGLMPTPKQGTVVDEDNIKKTVEDLKKGSLKIKVNKNLMSQIPVGTLNMDKDALCDNISHIISFINTNLPIPYLKANLKNLYLTSTQGPSISLNLFE